MDNWHDLIQITEDIKNKITNQQYRDLMKHLTIVYKCSHNIKLNNESKEIMCPHCSEYFNESDIED